jgi:hypothetical protein
MGIEKIFVTVIVSKTKIEGLTWKGIEKKKALLSSTHLINKKLGIPGTLSKMCVPAALLIENMVEMFTERYAK